jgi:flagellar M-ring protein FliF
VDPDQQVTTQEERSEIVPGTGQVGAGSTAMSAAYETSRRVETFSGAAGNIRRITVAVLLNENPSVDGGDARVWAPAELNRIETLVANAVGLDRTRGDQISVVSAPFVSSPIAAPTVEPIPSVFVRLPEYRNEIISVIGLVLAFVLGMQVLRVLRASVAATSAATAVSRQALAAARVPELSAHADPAAIAAAAPYAGLLARSAESPDMAARVLRAWMKDS